MLLLTSQSATSRTAPDTYNENAHWTKVKKMQPVNVNNVNNICDLNLNVFLSICIYNNNSIHCYLLDSGLVDA